MMTLREKYRKEIVEPHLKAYRKCFLLVRTENGFFTIESINKDAVMTLKPFDFKPNAS